MTRGGEGQTQVSHEKPLRALQSPDAQPLRLDEAAPEPRTVPRTSAGTGCGTSGGGEGGCTPGPSPTQAPTPTAQKNGSFSISQSPLNRKQGGLGLRSRRPEPSN